MKRIPLIICIAAVLIVEVSCNSTDRLRKTFILFMPTAPVYGIMPHDTIRPKALSEVQKQEMVDKFYKYGYDKYYGPRFDQLERDNHLLSVANHLLAQGIEKQWTIYFRMRGRFDSLKTRDDFAERQFQLFQKEKLADDKIRIENDKKLIAQNAQKIADDKRANDWYGFAIAVLLLFFVITFMYFRKLSKRMIGLERNVDKLRQELAPHE